MTIQKTKLDVNKFKRNFDTWWPVMQDFVLSGGLDPVSESLSKMKTKIYPKLTDLWKPFQLCKWDKLKVAIVAPGPYLDDKADGLALSMADWKDVTQLPEPLHALMGRIEEELYEGLCLNCVFQNDLSYLARQGILLLNTSLTGDEKGPHASLWEPFTRHVFEEGIAKADVPVLFLGEETFKFEEYLGPWQPRYLKPFPRMGWKSDGVFTSLAKDLNDSNNLELTWIETLPF